MAATVVVLVLSACSPVPESRPSPTHSLATPEPCVTTECMETPATDASTPAPIEQTIEQTIEVTLGGTDAEFVWTPEPGVIKQASSTDGPISFTIPWDGEEYVVIGAFAQSMSSNDATCSVRLNGVVIEEHLDAGQAVADCGTTLP